MMTAAGLVLGFGILYLLVRVLGSRWVERQMARVRTGDDRCPHGVLLYWSERRCTTCKNKLEMEMNTEEYWKRRLGEYL